MRYSLTVYSYANTRKDTDLWINFKRCLPQWSGPSHFDHLCKQRLALYGAELIAGEGRVEFASAEVRMLFVLEYS